MVDCTFDFQHISGEFVAVNTREAAARYMELGYSIFCIPQMFGDASGYIVLCRQDGNAMGCEDAIALLEKFEQQAMSQANNYDAGSSPSYLTNFKKISTGVSHALI